MDEPVVETELADSEPPRRSGPWKLIIVVVVLTLIGVWLVPGDPPEDDPATVESEPESPSLLTDGSEGPPAGESPLPPVPEVEPVHDSPGAMARTLIARMRAAGDIKLDQVFAAGEQAQAKGALADAYLLYFFAAREGFAPAAMKLGAQADPASRDPLNSVFESPDMTQAYKWYQMAAQNGDSEASERLADLRNRVDQLAASGDPQAQRISLLWQ
jgi:TPR repeat protein